MYLMYEFRLRLSIGHSSIIHNTGMFHVRFTEMSLKLTTLLPVNYNRRQQGTVELIIDEQEKLASFPVASGSTVTVLDLIGLF